MDTILSVNDIKQFKELGYLLIKNAVTDRTANDCRNIVWDRIEDLHSINRYDSNTWTHSKIAVGESFGKELGYPWDQVFSPRLLQGINELCGEVNESFGAGWWTMSFPTDSEKEKVNEGSWHIDGHGIVRYPYSSEIGLTLLMYFSNVKPNYGGTIVAEGSHIYAIRNLIECGLRGCKTSLLHTSVFEHLHLFNKKELTGNIGDVFIIHPYLLHVRGVNRAPLNDINSVRFLCHPTISLKNYHDFSKSKDLMTQLELSIYESVEYDEFLLKSLLSITPIEVDHFNSNDQNEKISIDIPDDMISAMGIYSFGNKKQRYK
eukprot:gene19783-25723_t